MRLYSLSFFSICGMILAGLGFSLGSIPLGTVGVGLILLWIVLICVHASEPAFALPLALATSLAVIELFQGGNTYLAAFALTAALLGWEFVQSAATIAPFPKEAQQSFSKRHLWQMLALGAAGLLLSSIALQVCFPLTFAPALGLGLAALLLLGLVMRTGRRSPPKSKHRGRRSLL